MDSLGHAMTSLPDGCRVQGDRYAGAIFSADAGGPDSLGTYRYVLWRRFDDAPGGVVLVVMLNPSTATHEILDPTVGGVVKRANAWNANTLLPHRSPPFREVRVCNLYALRSTDPKGLRTVADSVGPHNDYYLLAECKDADLVICGWGRHAKAPRVSAFGEIARVAGAQSKLRCFRKLSDGMPEHPLYIPHALPLETWP
jgi:hypothetical protein